MSQEFSDTESTGESDCFDYMCAVCGYIPTLEECLQILQTNINTGNLYVIMNNGAVFVHCYGGCRKWFHLQCIYPEFYLDNRNELQMLKDGVLCDSC